jgi:hypothetical protein
MQRPRFLSNVACTIGLALTACSALAQQPEPQQEKKPALENPGARLASAKNVMVTRARGSSIPYEVIKSTLDGWGRFSMVESTDKADLVVTVATNGGEGNMHVSSSAGFSPFSGRYEQNSSSSKDVSNAEITMTVYDARNKRVLWVSTETAKFAMKQTVRENNLVEAAERLTSRFHDRLEPPPPKDRD